MVRGMTKEEKYRQMIETPVNRLIPRLAIPTIISMLVTSIYNMADTFFVSQLSTSASGAVGVMFSAMSMIQAIGFTLGMGSGNHISRSLGNRDEERAGVFAATAFYTAAIIGVGILAVGTLFSRQLVFFLGATETIAPYAQDYARYILIGAPFMMTSFVMNNILRSQGNAVFAMVGVTVGGILNMILDPLLIFGLDLGISGAAIATMVSQIISFCILLYQCNARPDCIKIQLSKFRPSGKVYGQILHAGLPSFCRQGLASAAAVILNFAAGPYGDAAIAAMSIVTRFMMFINSSLIGFGQGFQPVSAFNYGAGKYSRVREGFWFSIRSSLVVLSISAVAGFFCSGWIIALFRDDPEVIRVGVRALRAQCLSLFFLPISLCGNMLFQSIGRSGMATFLSMIRSGIVFIPILWIFSHVFGLLGIQISQVTADIISAAITLPFVVSFFRSMPEDRAENS